MNLTPFQFSYFKRYETEQLSLPSCKLTPSILLGKTDNKDTQASFAEFDVSASSPGAFPEHHILSLHLWESADAADERVTGVVRSRGEGSAVLCENVAELLSVALREVSCEAHLSFPKLLARFVKKGT